MVRYGMAIDMGRCVGCQTCVVACQMHNALRPGIVLTKVDALEWGSWPDVDRAYLAHGCLHCEKPLCVEVCPTGASRRRDEGIVVIDYAKCIGCGVCLTACLYGARSINTEDRWFFDAPQPAPYENGDVERLNVAEKCDFCYERVIAGQDPVCVASCFVGARAFGDVEDTKSLVSIFIEESGANNITGTSLYYATGGRGLDLDRTISALCYHSSGDASEMAKAHENEVNPAVLCAAGAVGAASAVGLGLVARRNGARRKASCSEGQSSDCQSIDVSPLSSPCKRGNITSSESQPNKR